MFRIIKISFILVFLFDKLDAQINLNKTNLAEVCACDPMRSNTIYLGYKNIKTIDSSSFIGLSSLQTL